MDSPGASGWPSDLEDQVAELNTNGTNDQQTSLTGDANSVPVDYRDPNIQNTSTLSEAQTQQFLNFSFFPSHTGGQSSVVQPEQGDIIEEPSPQSHDIQTFTDALQQQLQQQLQGLTKDFPGWGALSQKGNLLANVGTPSTVILSIDGTQQEIPISFHIDPATALGATNTEQEIATIEPEELSHTYNDFEEVTENYIKSENHSTTGEKQQFNSSQQATEFNSNSPVKILTLTLENKPQVVGEDPSTGESVFTLPRNILPSTGSIDSEEQQGLKTAQTKFVESCFKIPEQDKLSNAHEVNDVHSECTIISDKETYENVRKSTRLREQVYVVRKKNQIPVFNPQTEYNPLKLWCEECQCSYQKECPAHKLTPLNDKAVLSRAWASLPPPLQIFRLSETTDAPELGVFTKKFIPSRTQFGPFIAETTESKEEQENSTFPLSMESEGKTVYLIASDENKCNWMMFVRAAETQEEQNLIAYQYADGVFFASTKDIHPREELKVWYAVHYANRTGKKILEKTVIKEDVDLEGKFECYECDKKLKSVAQLEQHVTEVHDNDGGGNEEIKEENVTGMEGQGSTVPEKSGSSFQSWKKKKRNLYFNKIKKYKEMRNKSKVKRKLEIPVYQCPDCSLAFEHHKLLNIHTLVHVGENFDSLPAEGENDALAQLSAAAAQLQSEAQQRKTLSENGLDTAELKCPCCKQVFDTTESLIGHTVVHARSRKMRQNRRNRLYDPQRPYQCPDCIKAFATEDRLNRHRGVHSKDDSFKPLQCKECGKRFMSPPALACHMKTHSDEKYYTCPICREGFDQLHVLKLHGESHASNGIFPCADCHKVFYDFNSVRKHMRIYHPYKELACPICPKVFPRVDKLKLHMLKHTDHKEYMCDQCGRQFKRKDKLREHSKRMHDPLNPKTKRQYNPESQPKEKFMPKVAPSDFHRFIYKCHACMLGFKRRGMLVNHLAKRHPGMKPDSIPELGLPILRTQRDFFCQYCDKVYKSSSKRKSHILKAHPGAEPPPGGRVGDETIQNQFGINCATYSQLTGSVAATPQACQFCHKQYASKPKLLQHQRKTHPNQVPPKRAVITATKQVPEKVVEMDTGTQDLEENIIELHDIGSTIIVQPEGQTADILTQAMSELTHSFTADYRPSSQQTPEHQRIGKATEYQINLTGLGGGAETTNQTTGIILQPTFVQTPVISGTSTAGAATTTNTAAVDLSQILQEITAQEDGISTALSQSIRIINGNQSQTLTLPLTFATQLLARSVAK